MHTLLLLILFFVCLTCVHHSQQQQQQHSSLENNDIVFEYNMQKKDTLTVSETPLIKPVEDKVIWSQRLMYLTHLVEKMSNSSIDVFNALYPEESFINFISEGKTWYAAFIILTQTIIVFFLWYCRKYLQQISTFFRFDSKINNRRNNVGLRDILEEISEAIARKHQKQSSFSIMHEDDDYKTKTTQQPML